MGKRMEECKDRTQKVLTVYDRERALITVTEEA
jgi:hypothetical protein